MWFWEIIWQDNKGRKHSLYSLQGYETMGQAYTVYVSSNEAIEEGLRKLNCKLIIDEQIVFKTEGALYD
jgi:hypothetical protein